MSEVGLGIIGAGNFTNRYEFGRSDGPTYAVRVADMNNDQLPDVVVGNVGQSNAVYFNQGNGRQFQEMRFGEQSSATYGLDVGDLDGDGFLDIVTANSGTRNGVFYNRIKR